MQKQFVEDQLYFQGLGRRSIVGDFDGSTLTSDAGGLLLREIDLTTGIYRWIHRLFRGSTQTRGDRTSTATASSPAGIRNLPGV